MAVKEAELAFLEPPAVRPASTHDPLTGGSDSIWAVALIFIFIRNTVSISSAGAFRRGPRGELNIIYCVSKILY